MPPPTLTQKLAVVLAFVAAALSCAAAILRYTRDGEVAVTPILGTLVMVALGVSGYRRLRQLSR